MKAVLGLIATGFIIVILVQWIRAGSSGPNVVGNIFANVVGYINLLK